MKPVLSLLEGKWFPRKHVSIRELFMPLFSVWTPQSDSSYHYEQFTTEDAFKAAIVYSFQSHRARTIYIGAHGDKDGIHGFHDQGISRTLIRNAFNDEGGTTRRGVYFGSCNFGNKDTAEFILPECPRVAWIAGYQTSVDWVDSSALDLFFFRHFLFPNPGKGNAMPRTDRDRLVYATTRIKADMAPLAKRLGFHVFVRKQGNGGIVNLI